MDDREAKAVARNLRGQATKLERYLSEQLGQKGDYSVVTALRATADRVAAQVAVDGDDVADDDPDGDEVDDG